MVVLCLCKKDFGYPFIPLTPRTTHVRSHLKVASVSEGAEVVITGLLPVFVLEYSGVADPAAILQTASAFRSSGTNPLAIVPDGVTPVPLAQVVLLATVPLIANGVASYFLVPLSIAVGRRPVLLLTVVSAWAGGFGAGFSTSLPAHIAARAVQGFGVGAVEALLPLIVQDMVFIHQRARATAAVITSQVTTYVRSLRMPRARYMASAFPLSTFVVP